MQKSYQQTGTVNTSNIYSALSNISSAASALALMAAIGGTAVSAPALASVAAALTVVGGILAVASVASKSTINVDALLNDIHDSLAPAQDALGSVWDQATKMVDGLVDAFEQGENALAEALNAMAEAAKEAMKDAGNAIANALSSATGIPVDALQKLLEKAANAVSPLIVDLDGDGVETSETTTWFDHDGNGYAQQTGWVGRDDGLLVLDKNQNGLIDDGSELFGNNTRLSDGELAENGFLALADYDSNGDGVIDINDEIFTRLKIWQDRNGDGITDEGELITLEQAGIKAINLDWRDTDIVDAAGNHHRQQGGYIKTDGTTGAISDVWFNQNPGHRVDKNPVPVGDDIAKLPDIIGSGNVSDLHQAMARSNDPALRSLVEQFIREEDPARRYELVDELLRQWSGASQYATDSRGRNIDAQKLYALEAFLGERFYQQFVGSGNPGANAAELLDDAWHCLQDNIYGQLMMQTHQAELIDLAAWHIEKGQIIWEADAIAEKLLESWLHAPEAALKEIASLIQTLKGVDTDFTHQILHGLAEITLSGNEDFSAILNTFSINPEIPIIAGLAGNDTLDAQHAALMLGMDGDDTLNGSGFADTLSGGRGNDILRGGGGDDTYLYASGDGHDVIEEKYLGGSDTLRLSHIGAERITVTRDGNDMLINVQASAPGAGDAGSIRLSGQAADASTGTGVEFITLDDGTRWDQKTLRQMMFDTARTDGDDIITGSTAADTLSGGRGNDTLRGGGGDDTYLYASGDGHDVIEEKYLGGSDTLRLSHIGAERITVTRDGNDMLINVQASAPGAGDAGSIRLSGQAADASYSTGVEYITLDDGTRWDQKTLRQMMFDTARTDGDDIITGSTAADTLSGGRGNDTLRGGAGDDTYLYASGDGHDTIEEKYLGGSDTLRLSHIGAERITVTRDGNDMLINVQASAPGAGDAGSIRLSGQAADASTGTGVEFITLDDGTRWDQKTLRQMMFDTARTDGDDIITGSTAADTLSGGSGNDTLRGGGGDDTYLYASGDGHDTIEEKYLGGSDTLRLSHIGAERITVTRDGDDMLINIRASAPGAGDAGSIRLSGQAADASYSTGVEYITLDDGTRWDQKTLRQMMFDTARTDGDDIITGSTAADTLSGGRGNDILRGGAGDDTYLYASGDGHDVIEEKYLGGSDTLRLSHIGAERITVTRDGDDMLINIQASAPGAGDAGSIRLLDQLSTSRQTGVETLEWDNGDIWDLTDPSIFTSAQTQSFSPTALMISNMSELIAADIPEISSSTCQESLWV
ncbi:hypothetical protein [Erwinia sp. HR93]|uniref:hypothetical protein n=1 Tax=Erwinia sp. HR93 TaxID=3094840 RepID=UPI002ADEB4B0|nr:hypothetical protein [Erwinia sp. HR93]MEA1063899.1 hypothetical protein [Erwinia sp. HR93]